MNKLSNLIIVALCFMANTAIASNPSNTAIKKVLISQVVDHPALNSTTQGIIDGLADAGYKHGINLEMRVESAQANAAMAAQIANKFVAQNPDVVVGVGTISAQSFIKYAMDKRVKLIFSSVTDPIASHLARNQNKPIEHVGGVSNFVKLEPQLQLFKDIQPHLKRLGIIYNPGEINSVSIVRKLEPLCVKLDINLIRQTVTKTADVAQAAVKLAGQTDAIFISNDNTALSSLQSIIKAAQQQNKPVYVSDTDAVEVGALAALGPNQYEVGKQTGLMIAKVLNGASLDSIPIEYPRKTELVINMQAAARVGIRVPQNIMNKANKILKFNQL